MLPSCQQEFAIVSQCAAVSHVFEPRDVSFDLVGRGAVHEDARGRGDGEVVRRLFGKVDVRDSRQVFRDDRESKALPVRKKNKS